MFWAARDCTSVGAPRRSRSATGSGRVTSGVGLATESSAALTRVAFELCDVDRVEIRVDPANEASLPIPRKLGFVEEGILRRRLPPDEDGVPRDVIVFSLFRDGFVGSPASSTSRRGLRRRWRARAVRDAWLVYLALGALFVLVCGLLAGAWAWGRLGTAAVVLFVAAVGVWVLDFAAISSDYRDADGFFDCADDCTGMHFSTAVGLPRAPAPDRDVGPGRVGHAPAASARSPSRIDENRESDGEGIQAARSRRGPHGGGGRALARDARGRPWTRTSRSWRSRRTRRRSRFRRPTPEPC